MPATPLTIEGRAAANRMSADVFPHIEGNLQMIERLQNEDAATVSLLHDAVAASGGSAGLITGIAASHALLQTTPEWSGNIGVWPKLFDASAVVVSACDYLDALPAPPVEVGVTQAINKEARPLVQLRPEDRPLLAAAITGSVVKIENSVWPSINDQSFTITVASRPLAQFYLEAADTTDETEGAGADATVWLEP